MSAKYKLFYTSNTETLGKQVASILDVPIGKYQAQKFSDGEVFVRFDESVRGQTIFIIAQANMPYENLFELFLAADAARRASVNEIICVIPYLPHSRQERKDKDRTSIASRVVADFLQDVGINRLITIDLHTNSIEGFYKIHVDHLDTSKLFIPHIRENFKSNLCLCSPDFGGLKRIKKYKNELNCDMAVIHKERLRPNQVSNMEILGDVSDKNVVIIDDMVDTAGTLCKAADLIMQSGAISVSAYCTHALLSGNAHERIQNSALSKLYVTDTLPNIKLTDKIEIVSVAPLLATAINHINENRSIKDYYEE
ncbi:ribose-phosphate diphosphokinase [Marinigracilibium pacificum]|uniref:ribose-phosphate diphosphokinase n=1 Tax=Marinigracilibium pacificum TaxID=2729599 RepID=A0A848J096_9BACT|nr:ribose-phosphate diphosphokinase [Marinigracilibium pacificum]NMM49266.1 ribose-phosphate diphosphokinase [Marinigracilibium pacificum]